MTFHFKIHKKSKRMVCLRKLSDVPIKNLYGSRQIIIAEAILFLRYQEHLKFLAYPVGEGGAKIPNCVKNDFKLPLQDVQKCGRQTPSRSKVMVLIGGG